MKQLSLNKMAILEGGGGSSENRACYSACALYSFACANGLGFLKRLASRLIDVYCTGCGCNFDHT
ncbi:MAG TPA: hypothetical protein PKM27_09515 [Saprospiraceae bacterium]|nr:hypothetical protein [Saprospiraceae bacterium]HNT21435.1 hypothetical protein [Saprospiraceae bacterium]